MNEIIFLVGFIIFIAAILVLDMLVIDRKAHVVPSRKRAPGRVCGLRLPCSSPSSCGFMGIWCMASKTCKTYRQLPLATLLI